MLRLSSLEFTLIPLIGLSEADVDINPKVSNLDKADGQGTPNTIQSASISKLCPESLEN